MKKSFITFFLICIKHLTIFKVSTIIQCYISFDPSCGCYDYGGKDHTQIAVEHL